MGRWNDGKLEYWNAGRRSRQFSTLHHSIIPTFQYSNVPVFKSPIQRALQLLPLCKGKQGRLDIRNVTRGTLE
jgi:hypothetical protein